METVLSFVLGAIVGAGLAAWRLKGARTVSETLHAAIQGGGGPGEEQK